MEHVGRRRFLGVDLTGRYFRRKPEQNDVTSIKNQIL